MRLRRVCSASDLILSQLDIHRGILSGKGDFPRFEIEPLNFSPVYQTVMASCISIRRSSHWTNLAARI